MERDEKRLSDQRHSLEVTQARKDCAVSAKEALDEILGKNLWYKSFIVCVTCNHTPLCQQGQELLEKMACGMHLLATMGD